MKIQKIPLIFIIFGFMLSCIYSVIIIKKFDKNFTGSDSSIQNFIIKGDTKNYLDEAFIIKSQIKENVEFDKLGTEYRISYLYPRLLALFFLLSDEEIKEKSKNNKHEFIYKINNKKTFFLIFQSILYYLSILYLYKKIKKKIDYKNLNILIFFLCFEPTILQFHSNILTESIYFTLLIFLISLLIDFKNNFKYHFMIGLLLGIMYLQRSAALYLIFPIIIYYILNLKNFKIFMKYIFFIIIGQILILSILGYNNYKRSGVFHVIPFQMKHTAWFYLSDNIVSSSKNIDISTVYQKRLNDEKKWKEENNINFESEKDRLRLYDYYQKYFFENFLQNPLTGLKIIIWKSLQTSILDPGMVYSSMKQDHTINRYWENSFFSISERIIYSLIIYFISICGAFYFIKKKDYLLPFLFLLLGLYHLAILGWVGVSRYSVPSIVCISLFFSNGIIFIKNYFEKRLK